MSDLGLVAPVWGADVRLTLLAVPSTIVLARQLVRYTLTTWGFDRDVVSDSTLVMSEIVTNAVAAAPGRRIRRRCTLQDGAPLLECWDPSPDLPAPSPPSLTAESGRGLAIISAYADETGTRPSTTGEGKIIRARMPASPPSDPNPPLA
ncbi:ATP-binding protein [Actinomadura madurae]|uniref:ATP-binding protein n=1 Tax=Actinomadura madurae TaxID=1993 RepID=UPI002026E72F|nr:ATP-binding protein [Actinomadura madurae]URN06357.1 ATP-binding protein [Actinomadura madurae]